MPNKKIPDKDALGRKNASSYFYRYRFWWVFTIITHTIAALTQFHWYHADEWMQTLEPANLIASGYGLNSQEVGLHMRNLSWASCLALVLWLINTLNALGGDLLYWRRVGINLFCGFLDLAVLWSWIQILENEEPFKKLTLGFKRMALCLVILPWYGVFSWTSARIEHVSEIASWLTLGFFARKQWFASGISSAAIFAFRYPSGLISLGFGLSVLLKSYREKNRSLLLRFTLGGVLGLLLFGLADAFFYGRAWESLWMYLQFNVFTGAGAYYFGKQTIAVYWEYFSWNWSSHAFFIPLGIFLLLFSLLGLIQGSLKGLPWAIAVFIYLLGHAFAQHKEGRFMAPIEYLLRFAALYALVNAYLYPLFNNGFLKNKLFKKLFSLVGILVLSVNGIYFLQAIRSNFLRELGNRFELKEALKIYPDTCAIIVGRPVSSLYFMGDAKATYFPSPALGVLHNRLEYKDILEHARLADGRAKSLYWQEHWPECSEQQSVLIETRHVESEWETKQNCQLLPLGLLRWLPKVFHSELIARKAISGAWYRCDRRVFELFYNPQLAHDLYFEKSSKNSGKKFGYFSQLPPLGLSATEFSELNLCPLGRPVRRAFGLGPEAP